MKLFVSLEIVKHIKKGVDKMNSFNGMGRLIADPELSYGQNGTAIAKCTIAINRMKQDDADFIPIRAFGKTAEIISQYCRKGHRILIEGSLNINSYEKDGQKKTFANVIVNRFHFIEKANKKENDNSQSMEDITDNDEFPF